MRRSSQAEQQSLRTAGFHALADPTRQAILQTLAGERLHVDELALRFPISRPAVSKHLRTLKNAHLVQQQNEGRRAYYSVNLDQLAALERWLADQRRVWQSSLTRLKRMLEKNG